MPFQRIKTKIEYAWKLPEGGISGKTGVSLHSHTWHSLESLGFFPSVIRKAYLLPTIIEWADSRHYKRWQEHFDYKRGYWTSPISPQKAYELEAGQIERLKLKPLVSITDHDEISACLEIRALGHEIPISVEWTVPYKSSVFHLGVHNIPHSISDVLMREMRAYTARPDSKMLKNILGRLNEYRDCLVVFNHPLSNQGNILKDLDESIAEEFIKDVHRWLHALEINAMQSIKTNRNTTKIAERFGMPLVAGGDRHSLEPNAVINLSNARSFSAFVHEIREAKESHILFMPQYRKPIVLRYAENVKSILSYYPELSGRSSWHDRVFYLCSDGITRSFRGMVGDHRAVGATNIFVSLLGAVNGLLNIVTPVFEYSEIDL